MNIENVDKKISSEEARIPPNTLYLQLFSCALTTPLRPLFYMFDEVLI